jgi:hypothetical protein
MARVVSQLREVRKTIGPDALLMIDCLCQWDVPYTLEMVDRLQEFRLYWIEEPVSPDDIEGYARLCREVRGPLIAGGEHEYTRFGKWRCRTRPLPLQPDTHGRAVSPKCAGLPRWPPRIAARGAVRRQSTDCRFFPRRMSAGRKFRHAREPERAVAGHDREVRRRLLLSAREADWRELNETLIKNP